MRKDQWGQWWEVFNPRDGVTVFRSRYRLMARWVALWRGLDYAREGEGWVA